jgi:small-conductance mechanosensitive channel
MFNPVNDIVVRFFYRLTDFLPNLFGGIVGFLIAALLKRVLLSLFAFFKLSFLLQKTKLMDKGEVTLWEQVIAEIVRWTVIILFLNPALEVWGLSRATEVLNQFLLYIPNVIIAVIIGFIGMIAANLASDVVRQSLETIEAPSARTFAFLAKASIVFFTVLIVMNQIGIAQDLIRILFTGIIIMFALAGGLAFGLGGKDAAKEIIEHLKNKMK